MFLRPLERVLGFEDNVVGVLWQMIESVLARPLLTLRVIWEGRDGERVAVNSWGRHDGGLGEEDFWVIRVVVRSRCHNEERYD
jgi:hypothetical protein